MHSENREKKKRAISSLNDIQPELLKALYNLPPYFEVHVKHAEEKSGVKREHFVYGLSVFFALYMITGSEGGLLCNTICFIYPAIVSIQCIYCMYLYLPQTEGINIMEEKMQLALQNFIQMQARKTS
uniref:Receptor expression-enhancing protein n=1 Tax=Onchocerca volvulus TaxID=6282 RepID=A0A8R1TY29_ONCVO